MEYRLFLDETGVGDDSLRLTLCLIVEKDKYLRLDASYKDMKRSLAEDGIILRRNPPFHLREIKQRTNAFASLADVGRQGRFWSCVTRFVQEAPFMITASFVLADDLKRASTENWRNRVAFLGVEAVLENAVVLTPKAKKLYVSHDWVDENGDSGAYRDYVMNKVQAPSFPFVGERGTSDLFHGEVEWLPKKLQETGTELVDLMANPLLMSILSRSPGKNVAPTFVEAVAKKLPGDSSTSMFLRPFALRMVP